MATLDDLDREVRRLRKRVNELEGVGREQSEVAEIIGDGERRKFSSVVAASNEQLCEDLERQAIAVCRADNLKNPVALSAFRERFHRLGRTKLDELINRHCEP